MGVVPRVEDEAGVVELAVDRVGPSRRLSSRTDTKVGRVISVYLFFFLSIHTLSFLLSISECSLLYISGVFIARGKEDVLVTKNMVVGESVYGEKRIAVEVCQN